DLGEAVVKHGVRVHVFNLYTQDAGNPAVPEKLKRRRGWQGETRRQGLVAVGLISAVLLGVGSNLSELKSRFFPGSKAANSPAHAVQPRRSVAVLQFKNLSAASSGKSSEDAWLGTALPEWLTTELGTGNELRLVSSEDVARMARDLSLKESDSYSKDTLKRVRKVLNADYVVAGTYFTSRGNGQENVRVDLRIQETNSGEVLSVLSD